MRRRTTSRRLPVEAVARPEDAPAGWVVFRSQRDGKLIAVMPGSPELDLMHKEKLRTGWPEWVQVMRHS